MSDWNIRADRGGQMEVLTSAQMRELEPALSPAFTHGVLLLDHGYLANRTGWCARCAARRRRAASWSCWPMAASWWPRTWWWRRAPGHVRCWHRWASAFRWRRRAATRSRLPTPVCSSATPMEDGLRVAGTVEFAGLDAPPQYRRARKLLEQVCQVYPSIDTTRFTEWMGHRPCRPAIGSPRGPAGLMLAFGHGHNGMTGGPVTGRLVTELVVARRPFIDTAPFLPDRF
jgi:glycine/D-amino acid oxidase-like deaminating enzyme